jgi:hypothetical protein
VQDLSPAILSVFVAERAGLVPGVLRITAVRSAGRAYPDLNRGVSRTVLALSCALLGNCQPSCRLTIMSGLHGGFRRRWRCGITVYFGSWAEASPAWKMPHRVAAEAPSRAAPASLPRSRWRDPAREPTARSAGEGSTDSVVGAPSYTGPS